MPNPHPKPDAGHEWLHQLIGEWTFESKMLGPDAPAETFRGTESVRAFGDFWILAEGKGDMPGGGTANMLMTLGYDPAKGRHVGTWLGSMMPMLWIYDGELDAAKRVLTLSADGPKMTGDGGTAKYRDIITLEGKDSRTMTGNVLGDDGKWNQFMIARYTRKK